MYFILLFKHYPVICDIMIDIQEYYEVTLLDDTKSVQQKTQETLHVAARWEKQPLLPPQNEVGR